MKAVVAAFNQEKALVGAFSVITNLRMELFKALPPTEHVECGPGSEGLVLVLVVGRHLALELVEPPELHLLHVQVILPCSHRD